MEKVLNKLKAFIKKYYFNQLVKGSLVFLLLAAISILFFVFLEYFLWLSSDIRTWIFYGLVILLLIGFGVYIANPLLKYFRIGKIISYTQAAKIIGEYFPDIDDKLVNVLELNEQLSENDSELLLLSIEQKIDKIKPFDFSIAIDFKKSLRFTKYLLFPLAIILLVFITGNKNILTDSSKRLLQYSEEFEPDAPFRFQILNDSLESHSSKDFILKFNLEGESIPEDVSIELSEQWINVQEIGTNTFQYHFNHLQKDIKFRLKAGRYFSKPYTLKVIPFPKVKNLKVTIVPPSYTSLKSSTLNNQGDLQVAEGSEIRWEIGAENTQNISWEFSDTTLYAQTKTDKEHIHQKRQYTSEEYKINLSNQQVKQGENFSYRIRVIKDIYPSISVEEEKGEGRTSLFKGKIIDDYGFTNLAFVLKVNDSTFVKKIGFDKKWTQQNFSHFVNFEEMNLPAGATVSYYFTVRDNDRIHGGKTSKSTIFSQHIESVEELAEKTEETNEEIENELAKRLEDSKELKEAFKKLQAKLLQKKELNWQDKKQIKELLEKQKSLEEAIEDLKDKNQENIDKQEKYNKENERIKEKQEQIQDLLEDILDEDTKKMFDELEKLLEKFDKKQIEKKLEEMKMNNENIEKELDRSLEMLKQFQFEQKLDENIEKLNELQEKQEKLANEEKTEESKEEDLKKQEELNKEFDKLKEDLKKMEEMNKDLEQPNELPSTEEQQEQIEQEMKNSSDQLKENNKEKAKDSQKESAKKMEDMSQQMAQMQMEMQQEQQSEDMDALKQILENLIDLSFEEEGLMENISSAQTNDPRYIEFIKKQSDIRFKSDMIADSLYALSKRQITIEKTVRKEVGKLQSYLTKSLGNLTERRVSNAYKESQYAMTSANNLALLLSQILDQMQKQAGSPKKGSGSCNKPGSGNSQKPSMSGMKKMQKQMQGQLQSLQKELLNQGKNPGGKQGMGGLSKSLVQTAAKQEAIRRQLEAIEKSMQDGGKTGNKALKNAIEKMKEIERDIVNKNITPETLRRQQEIMQKMLEAEKAEKEQEKDKKRKAKEADQQKREDSALWKKYLSEKKKQTEKLYHKPLKYLPFYKQKVDQYMQENR
jgi:flagellar biosynthesis GTPase FlhF